MRCLLHLHRGRQYIHVWCRDAERFDDKVGSHGSNGYGCPAITGVDLLLAVLLRSASSARHSLSDATVVVDLCWCVLPNLSIRNQIRVACWCAILGRRRSRRRLHLLADLFITKLIVKQRLLAAHVLLHEPLHWQWSLVDAGVR